MSKSKVESRKIRLDLSMLLVPSEGLLINSGSQRRGDETGTTRALCKVAACSQGHLEKGMGYQKRSAPHLPASPVCCVASSPSVHFTGIF